MSTIPYSTVRVMSMHACTMSVQFQFNSDSFLGVEMSFFFDVVESLLGRTLNHSPDCLAMTYVLPVDRSEHGVVNPPQVWR